MTLPPLLRFAPQYFPRIWGGTRLRAVLGMPVPEGQPIGEAWLISDHPHCESVVHGGRLDGVSLRCLVREHGEALLGGARTTRDGRFPLLLKLIDSGELLSVQVHPDDGAAQRLGEPDDGKTELWHVIDAAPGAQVICGLKPGVDRAAFEAAIASGRSADCMQALAAPAGTSVFVPAGTVHAIGGGLMIAEIQQNSDITYRIYDWDRVDVTTGKPRALHVEKALAVIDFEAGAAQVRPAGTSEVRAMIATCAYFTAERLGVGEHHAVDGPGFRIVLATQGAAQVEAGGSEATLTRGEAVLIPAATGEAQVVTQGEALVYRAAA